MISRIFRGENENAAVKRKRQIDTLKIFNDNVVELRQDIEYQVEFNVGEKRMAIMVSLSPEFPMEKPVLRVSPPINHPWCNEHSEITSAPGLLNFTVHSDLGRVVQAIIRELIKYPPQLQDEKILASLLSQKDLQGSSSPSYTLQRYTDLPSTSYNSFYNSLNSQFSTPNTSSERKYNFVNTSTAESHPFAASSHHMASANLVQYSTPSYKILYSDQPNYEKSVSTVGGEFPELNTLSNEELKRLGEDTESLDTYLEEQCRLKNFNLAIDEAIDDVEKIATENLTKEAELEALQKEVTSKGQTVIALKARYDSLIQQYSKLSEVFAPDHIKECLKCAADESHERSETIVEDFLSRKIDVERFLSMYIKCRKLGQARRTKEEKLDHQLNELKRAGY
ncbi:vacuolar protein sorting-associated protein 37A [Diachasmimorpha longicaudata]|uniref:vacuolar protein sorting-associated protein 37A n=1 Tax=Diachasmimorpha longicaudata TaxID=58733 RepID=UPI0030B86F14